MKKRDVVLLMICAICLCALSHPAVGQIQKVNSTVTSGNNKLQGWVDDSTGARIPFAHVFFIVGKDTTRLAAGLHGQFAYEGLVADTMRVRVTAVGYEPFEGTYYPKTHGLHIRLRLRRAAVVLNEIIITGNRVAMVVKGDTLQYNAEAFTALEGDFMEVLLKKMPGVTYENGSLRVNGEPISRVYVNGRSDLFKNAKDVFENVKADNVKDIKVYDERNKDDRRLGMKYGKRETVMDVTTKRKVDAVRRGTLLLGGGVDVSRDRTSMFKEKYDLSVNHSSFGSGKNSLFSAYYKNISPRDLQKEERVFGGTFSYSRGNVDIGKWSYNTRNEYKNTTGYSRQESEQTYFPTEQFASRDYLNRFTRKNRDYFYKTDHNVQWKSSLGFSSAMLSYEYRGATHRMQEKTLSRMDGNELGSANVTDCHETHYSDFFIQLTNKAYFKTKGSKRIGLDVGGNVKWRDERGDGWRVDTLDASSEQVNLDKDFDGNHFEVGGFASLSYPLSSLWKSKLGYEISYRKSASRGEVVDLLTGWLDTTNTRDYSIVYLNHKICPGFSFYQRRTEIYINLNMEFLTRRHDEYFPLKSEERDHFYLFSPLIEWKQKFAANANLVLAYSAIPELPTVEATRAALDDTNPLALRAGNPDIKVPLTHTIRFEWNKIFVQQQSSSVNVLLHYYLTRDYITTNNRYFTEDTYLPEYDYTALKGATLYSMVNTESQHDFQSNVGYSLLSKWLKSYIKFFAGYRYKKTPSFVEGELNYFKQHIGHCGVNAVSNFSTKIELSFNNRVEYSRNRNVHRALGEFLDEQFRFTVRTTVIPKFTFNSTFDYQYRKDFSDGGGSTEDIQWKASLSRKLGKQATITLDGYNLLDKKNARSIGKTAEYFSRTERSQTGRFVMLSLKYEFN